MHECVCDIAPGDLAVFTAELGDELPLVRESGSVRADEPVGGAHVHTDQLAMASHRNPRSAPDHVVAAGRARDRDRNSFASLPGRTDAMGHPVGLERVVGVVGDPHQCELAQCAEVAGPEVIGERGVDLLGCVDVAVSHAAPKCFRRHVDQLDLVG